MNVVTIKNVKAKDKKVKGKATTGLKASVKISGKTYSSKIKKSGYSIKIPKQKKNTKITVKVQDNAGNVSSAVTKVKK